MLKVCLVDLTEKGVTTGMWPHLGRVYGMKILVHVGLASYESYFMISCRASFTEKFFIYPCRTRYTCSIIPRRRYGQD